MPGQSRTKRNEVVGVVVSDKMQKTISVEVYRLIRHSKYGKFQRTSSVYKAHDEKGEAKSGDKVRIFQCRPYSKTKRWALAEVVEKKKLVEGVEI
ncbi:MAG: 30S ribosomal protein S17 [Bdellovibrionales bacterium]|nr:30S ribosomal protein S17 [Bdellovibrionales bacterium]